MSLNQTIFQQTGGLSSYLSAVCRMVGTQEYAATLSLVDNLDEQAVLESILDGYKPPHGENSQDRHYLFSAPFRYPPQQYGSRFGARYEPSYFYASESVACCLAEAAFYRFVLIEGTEKPFDMLIRSQHSLFYVNVQSDHAVDLCAVADEDIQTSLKHPSSYAVTQDMGKYSREIGAKVIRYFSARHGHEGVNIAVDDHNTITSNAPENMINFLCEIDPQQGIVRFSTPKTSPVTFKKEQFMVDGLFPDL